MEKRRLGRTDIEVSLICLGTMTWGQQNTPEEGFEQMDYAVSRGINFFDTAELYSIPPRAETFGRTEEIIGEWFKKTGKRKDVVLATKIAGDGSAWIRDGNSMHHDKANMTAALEGSLKRLQTDYIDLYQLHWPNRPVNSFGRLGFPDDELDPAQEEKFLSTLQNLDTHIRAGKIRHWGVSNETAWGVMKFISLAEKHGLPRPVSIQNPYNLLNRSFEVGLSEVARQEDVSMLAYSPLARGYLTGKYLDGKLPPGSMRSFDTRKSRYDRPAGERAIRAYLAIAKKHGIDPAQLAIAFVNTRQFMASNIIGATSMAQLKTDIDSIHVKLSDEVLAEIAAVHADNSNPCP